MNQPQLSRATCEVPPAAPVRIVHLGLGAFHRAHQAWYTQHADPAGKWGIAAFTGRRPDAAVSLAAQDGLYTLIERADSGDTLQVISSIVQAYDGADVARLVELVASPATALVTLTITEAAYHLGPDGRLDTANPELAADIRILQGRRSDDDDGAAGDDDGAAADDGDSAAAADDGATSAGGEVGGAPSGGATSGRGDEAGSAGGRWATTVPGRLVQALSARRRSGAGPIAVVSCDNLAHNGAAAQEAVQGLAAAADAGLAGWIGRNVSFVSTSVDRITPRTTDAERELVSSASGLRDETPVVTEPFRSWVLSGDFPAGRPEWELAGAIFVDGIAAFEQRKLWLLNGAHSLLAYAGQLRGHQTVAQALADPQCRAWITDFWNEAEANLPAKGLELPAYRQSLLERFGNARIAHYLAQIGVDGSSKLRMRAVPVLKAELAAGRSGEGAARVIGAWVAFLRASIVSGAAIEDSAAAALQTALALPPGEDTLALLQLLDPELAEMASVLRQVGDIARGLAPESYAA